MPREDLPRCNPPNRQEREQIKADGLRRAWARHPEKLPNSHESPEKKTHSSKNIPRKQGNKERMREGKSKDRTQEKLSQDPEHTVKTKPPRQVLKTNQGAMMKGKTYPKAQHREDQ